MIIDLNSNVDLCEYAKVTVRGINIETVDIVTFSFSKEALIGFAKKLRVNSLDYEHGIQNSNVSRSRREKCIEILPPAGDDLLEEYELGFRNLAGIIIHNKNNVNISKDIYEVFLEINYEGLKNLAILLMKLADNYKEGAEYILKQVDEVILASDSLPVKIKLANLGNVYDYEPGFGQKV